MAGSIGDLSGHPFGILCSHEAIVKFCLKTTLWIWNDFNFQNSFTWLTCSIDWRSKSPSDTSKRDVKWQPPPFVLFHMRKRRKVTDFCLTIKCRKQIKRATDSLHCIQVRWTNRACRWGFPSVIGELMKNMYFHKKERHNAIPMISNNKRSSRPTTDCNIACNVLGSVRDTNRNEESFLGIWAYAKSIFTCLKRSIDLRNGLLFAMA